MPTIEEIKTDSDHSQLIRKALQGAAFIAPITADIIPSLTDEEGQFVELPADYMPVGMVSKDDGYTFGSSSETSEVTSLGYASPTRMDITSQSLSIAFTAQETNRTTLELAYGMDLSSVTPATSGEISFDRPDVPLDIYYRLIVIAADGFGTQAWALGRHFPRVKVTEIADVTWSDTDAVTYGITLTGFPDAEEGFSERNFLGGPGAQANADAMGFGAGS